MTKVKVFIFNISNYNTAYKYESDGSLERGTQKMQLEKEEEIEKVINKFIEGKEVLSIEINSATVHRHNNARCDIVNMYYTIHYKG